MNKVYQLLCILGLSLSLICFADDGDDEDSSDDSATFQAAKKNTSGGLSKNVEFGDSSQPQLPPS